MYSNRWIVLDWSLPSTTMQELHYIVVPLQLVITKMHLEGCLAADGDCRRIADRSIKMYYSPKNNILIYVFFFSLTRLDYFIFLYYRFLSTETATSKYPKTFFKSWNICSYKMHYYYYYYYFRLWLLLLLSYNVNELYIYTYKLLC